MPSQSSTGTRSICFIGDSQVASVKRALDERVTTPPPNYEIEFWAAPGAEFRQIVFEDGVIRATGPAIPHVTHVNAAGRDHIAVDDFDHLVFYGGRLGVPNYFGSVLQWMSEQPRRPSRAALERSAASFVICTRAYRHARDMAAQGAHVTYFPAPFNTLGVRDLYRKGYFFHHFPAAENATQADRDVIWDALQTVADRDGITLMRQPEETVTKGVLTKAEYMVDGAIEAEDVGHKSPAFAALWLEQYWRTLPKAVAAA
ncbi:MAG: hypothetical protein AB3N09_05540 [Tateyamaria sp.]